MHSDDPFVARHVRVRRTSVRIMVEVLDADTDAAGFEIERWSLAAMLPLGAAPVDVDRAVLRTLSDYRWFARCDECGDRQQRGKVTSHDGSDLCPECLSEKKTG